MSRRQELPDSPTARIPGAAVELLRAAVLGDVLVAGNEEYEGARAVWNGMIDRANRYARELAVTALLAARAMGAPAVSVLITCYVLATVLHGHPPFNLSWFRP